MATSAANPTPITPPRVALIDQRTGLIDRAWYMFFLSLFNAATTVQDADVGPSTDSLLASFDAQLRALSDEVGTQYDAQSGVASLAAALAALEQQFAVQPSTEIGELQQQIDALNQSVALAPVALPLVSAAMTKVDDTNVTLTLGGSPTTALLAATSLTLGWSGTLAVGRGGLGISTTPSNGLIPIGNGTNYTAAALTAGTGVTITNAAGAITIAATAGGGSAPITKTANFSVAAGETWYINNKTGSACTVTLPAASGATGRELKFVNYQLQTVISASSNVVPLGGGSAGTAMLAASVGDWATLVSDGTNWIIMQAAANNSLLLE